MTQQRSRKPQEAAFGALFDGANDAMLIVKINADAVAMVQSANRRALELLHRPRERIVGHGYAELFTEPATISASGIFNGLLRHDDGITTTVEISVGPATADSAGAPTCLVVIREASECRQEALQLKSTNDLVRAINTLQKHFIGDAPIGALYKEIVEILLALTGSEYGFLGESLQTTDHRPYFKIQALSDSVWRCMTRDFFSRHAPIGLEFYNLDNRFGEILRTAQPRIVNDPATLHRIADGLPDGHPPLHSFLGLPIVHGSEVFGMVCLANREQGYDAEVVSLLAPLLTTCGNLIAASRASQWRRGAESEMQRQALVFENISDAVILTDRGGHVLDCNPAVQGMFGFPKKRLLGVPLELMLPSDTPGGNVVTQAVAAVSRNGYWNGILSIPRGTGEASVWETSVLALSGDSTSEDGALVWFGRDITEQQAAQARLAARTLELDTIVDQSPDGYVFIDQKNEVSYVNPAFERMTGLPGRNLTGMTHVALDTAIAGLCDNKDNPACLSVTGEGDLFFLARPCFTILSRTVRVLRHDSGSAIGTVHYYRDVTQEAEVDRIKSDFLSTAAHELRTPMASIFGFSELLLKREVEADKRRHFIEIIHRQSGQLVALINELLDLARIEARGGKGFNIGEHALAPILREAVAEFLMPGDERRVTMTLPTHPQLVRVDPDKLHLAVGNVLSNAFKYSQGQGSVDLRILTRDSACGHQLGIAISDQGIGMSRDEIAKIFERFYRADVSGKIPGTGLGMSIVKEIIDIFHGDITIESTPGVGTCITLWLPTADEREAGDSCA